MIYENEVLIKKQYIKYSNIKRIFVFLYEYLFSKKFKADHKIILLNNSIKIIYPALINQNIKKKIRII